MSFPKIKLKVVEEKEEITNEWTVERVAKEYPPPSWESVFENSKNELKDISDMLEEDRKKNGERLPYNKDLFRAFFVTPLHRVKVVVLGQDVYMNYAKNGVPNAMGLSFSVPKGNEIPSSLRNIFKELKNSVPEFNIPSHGDLTQWALQGVFLINSSLTVRPGEAGCHKQLWYSFLKKVFNAILEVNPDCIFVAWGNNAQSVCKKFLGERATILTAAHPSGLSCHKGYLGCNHFVKINEILKSKNLEPIDWNLY